MFEQLGSLKWVTLLKPCSHQNDGTQVLAYARKQAFWQSQLSSSSMQALQGHTPSHSHAFSQGCVSQNCAAHALSLIGIKVVSSFNGSFPCSLVLCSGCWRFAVHNDCRMFFALDAWTPATSLKTPSCTWSHLPCSFTPSPLALILLILISLLLWVTAVHLPVLSEGAMVAPFPQVWEF